jgi:hypothetical protein
MFDSGYWTLGRFRGLPLRVHWSVPLAALLLGQFAPLNWILFVLIVLVHELGHAALVWRYGLRVVSIDLTGFGGLCRWSGNATAHERAVIAWGGVLAQAALVIVALIAGALFSGAGLHFWAAASADFVRMNLVLIAVNLLPIPPLDGAEAWRVFGARAGRGRVGGAGWGLGAGSSVRRWWSQVVHRLRRSRSGAQQGEGRRIVDEALSGPKVRPAPRRSGAGGARESSGRGAGAQQREFAEWLEQLGRDAGQARRGKPD